MEYEVGKPYLWFGGDCPLPKGTKVNIRLGKKDMYTVNTGWTGVYSSEEIGWGHSHSDGNVVMFKVVSYPHPEPVKRSVTLELTEDQIKAIESVLAKESRLAV